MCITVVYDRLFDGFDSILISSAEIRHTESTGRDEIQLKMVASCWMERMAKPAVQMVLSICRAGFLFVSG